jgi:3-methylfumaryl-CoA hydratase
MDGRTVDRPPLRAVGGGGAVSGIDMDRLGRWIGRSETATDRLDRSQAARLALTLDCDRVPADGDILPPLWHWAFFPPRVPQSGLGADGHPERGGVLPPVPLPRRMWAGGRLTFVAPLRIGEAVTRETEVVGLTEKRGRQGALVLLTLRHRLSNGAGIAVEEEQDIVYRAPGGGARPACRAPAAAAAWRDRVEPDAMLLFRYSAVTFNAHRIHYDLPYAVDREGYPALVVQGPLTATLLAGALARHAGGRIVEFGFRGEEPLFADAPFYVCGARDSEGWRLWAEGPGGYVAMSATARTEA